MNSKNKSSKISKSNLIKGDFIFWVVYQFRVAWMGQEIKFLWVFFSKIHPEEVLLVFFFEVCLVLLDFDIKTSGVCMGWVQLSKSDSFWLHRLNGFGFGFKRICFICLDLLSIVLDDSEGILIHINDKILVEKIKNVYLWKKIMKDKYK